MTMRSKPSNVGGMPSPEATSWAFPEFAAPQEDASIKRAQRHIGPVNIEVARTASAVREIFHAIRQGQARVFAFCNMHTFNVANRDDRVASALAQATVYNDGIGIDIASRILFGEAFPENLNGTDLTPAVLASLVSLARPARVYLLGGKAGVVEQCARALEARFAHITIVGSRHGYFPDADSVLIADEIAAVQADLVLVGMGNPRQELWAVQVCERANAVLLCVGAYIDFSAGHISRAPYWVRRMRCEWIYRLVLEPSRMWRRYLGGAAPFLWAILCERFAQRRGAAKGKPHGRSD